MSGAVAMQRVYSSSCWYMARTSINQTHRLFYFLLTTVLDFSRIQFHNK